MHITSLPLTGPPPVLLLLSGIGDWSLSPSFVESFLFFRGGFDHHVFVITYTLPGLFGHSLVVLCSCSSIYIDLLVLKDDIVAISHHALAIPGTAVTCSLVGRVEWAGLLNCVDMNHPAKFVRMWGDLTTSYVSSRLSRLRTCGMSLPVSQSGRAQRTALIGCLSYTPNAIPGVSPARAQRTVLIGCLSCTPNAIPGVSPARAQRTALIGCLSCTPNAIPAIETDNQWLNPDFPANSITLHLPEDAGYYKSVFI